jgi:hypothetical protein
MTDTPYEGFRFQHSCPDMNAPGGVQKVHYYISVQQSRDAAIAAVENLTGSAGSLTLLGQGASVLREAIKRGIADGQTVAL